MWIKRAAPLKMVAKNALKTAFNLLILKISAKAKWFQAKKVQLKEDSEKIWTVLISNSHRAYNTRTK